MKPRIQMRTLKSLVGDGLSFGGQESNGRFATAWPYGGVWTYEGTAKGRYMVYDSYEEAQVAALDYVMEGAK